MQAKYQHFAIFMLLAFAFSFCIHRDMQIEKQYTVDLRNRVVGARLQKDGKLAYFYRWRPVDGLRYYDPNKLDTTYANAITASPFFHHLLYTIADLPQREISRIWLALEYFIFLSCVLIAFSFTENLRQQWAVAIAAVLLLFTQAWVVHIIAGQMYIVFPFLAFIFLFCFIRKEHFLFSFLSGLAAATIILIRPTCALFFLPFLPLLKTFRAKHALLFFLPAIILSGYSILNKKERSYWMEYRKAIAAHIKDHQSDDLSARTIAYKPVIYKDWEGWSLDSIRNARMTFPVQWLSESSSIGIFSKQAFHKTIPVWVINSILLLTIAGLLVFWFKQNNSAQSGIVLTALFGFCIYMISDFISPLWRIQYYGVQWAFPLLLLSAYYDRRLRNIYLLLLAGLLLNILNTPWLKMRHTIGEMIILFTLLWVCFGPKARLINGKKLSL
jgi:hypothetical protein